MSIRTVRVGEVDLCLESFGDPADPTLLLISGAAASMDWWPPGLCRVLADGGRHVVRFDHRDTGGSTTWPVGEPGYGGGALTGDVVGLLELLGAEGGGPAHLVGVSMGGGIAQSVAVRRPDLVASLTLVATSPTGGVDHDTLPPPSPAVLAGFDAPPPPPDWTDREAVVDHLLAAEADFAGSLGVDEAEVRRAAGAAFDRSPSPGSADNHWLVVGGSEEGGDNDGGPDDITTITAPTLVVHGSDDPLFPLAHGEAIAAAVPDARLLVLDGMGHQVPPASTWGRFVPAVLEVGWGEG